MAILGIIYIYIHIIYIYIYIYTYNIYNIYNIYYINIICIHMGSYMYTYIYIYIDITKKMWKLHYFVAISLRRIVFLGEANQNSVVLGW